MNALLPAEIVDEIAAVEVPDVVARVKPDVERLIKTKGATQGALTTNGRVSEEKINNRVGKAIHLIENQASRGDRNHYPLLHKYRDDILKVKHRDELIALIKATLHEIANDDDSDDSED